MQSNFCASSKIWTDIKYFGTCKRKRHNRLKHTLLKHTFFMFFSGVGFGWNLASMTRSGGGGSSNYSGLGQNYRDYSSALSFLGSNGSFFSVIHRLMHDPSHLYEFPVSQLPPGYHKTRGLSTITGGPTSGTIPLTAFEFYFYHFVSLLVRFYVFIFA